MPRARRQHRGHRCWQKFAQNCHWGHRHLPTLSGQAGVTVDFPAKHGFGLPPILAWSRWFVRKDRYHGPKVYFQVASVAIVFLAGEMQAQESPLGVIAPSVELPETILVPMRSDGRILPYGGWELVFRNMRRGLNAPIEQIESTSVSYKDSNGDDVVDHIVWEILRTANSPCEAKGGNPCPDTITVISIPEGFLAVPESARVNEGSFAKILIFRDVTG